MSEAGVTFYLVMLSLDALLLVGIAIEHRGRGDARDYAWVEWFAGYFLLLAIATSAIALWVGGSSFAMAAVLMCSGLGLAFLSAAISLLTMDTSVFQRSRRYLAVLMLTAFTVGVLMGLTWFYA